MKVDFEVKAFGKEEANNAIDAFRSTELARTHQLSKETTLGELEQLISALFSDISDFKKGRLSHRSGVVPHDD